MLIPWLYGLFHIVRNKKIDTPEKIGWFITCLVGTYLGLFLYAFFRKDIMNALYPILSSMAHEKKLEMDEKWKK
ncbi:MAG: PLDc N-terminal domain-containing protein [Opitutaceae bacterium]